LGAWALTKISIHNATRARDAFALSDGVASTAWRRYVCVPEVARD